MTQRRGPLPGSQEPVLTLKADQSDKSAAPKPAKPARNVFWAEDAEDDQFLIRTAAESLKPRPEITFFEDGDLLLEALKGKKPDLVVLDIRMPRLDGIQTLKRLRGDAATKALPVVMFSTAMIEEEVAACRELGVRDFLQKPAHYTEFTEAVAKIVGATPRERPAQAPRRLVG